MQQKNVMKEIYVDFLSLRVTLSLIQDLSAIPGQTSRINISIIR